MAPRLYNRHTYTIQNKKFLGTVGHCPKVPDLCHYCLQTAEAAQQDRMSESSVT